MQRRQRAREAAQQLTPGMVQSALTELLWHIHQHLPNEPRVAGGCSCILPTDCNAYVVHVLPAQQL